MTVMYGVNYILNIKAIRHVLEMKA